MAMLNNQRVNVNKSTFTMGHGFHGELFVITPVSSNFDEALRKAHTSRLIHIQPVESCVDMVLRNALGEFQNHKAPRVWGEDSSVF